MLGSSRQVELEHLQAPGLRSTLMTNVSTSSFLKVSKAYPRHQTKGIIEYARAMTCEPKLSFVVGCLLTLMFFDSNNFGHCGLQYAHVTKYPGKRQTTKRSCIEVALTH